MLLRQHCSFLPLLWWKYKFLSDVQMTLLVPLISWKTPGPSAGGYNFRNHRTGIELINRLLSSTQTRVQSVGGIWPWQNNTHNDIWWWPNEILLNLVFIKNLEIPCEKGNRWERPLSFVHVTRNSTGIKMYLNQTCINCGRLIFLSEWWIVIGPHYHVNHQIRSVKNLLLPED